MKIRKRAVVMCVESRIQWRIECVSLNWNAVKNQKSKFMLKMHGVSSDEHEFLFLHVSKIENEFEFR